MNRRISILSVVGLAGIVACIAIMAADNQTSLIQAYGLLSSSKNYLNHWFTGNIYFFISLLTIGIMGLLLSHVKKESRKMGGVRKMFVALGDHSYILYLFHWPILTVIKKFVGTWAVTFPAALVASIIASAIFNKLYSAIQKN